MPRHVLTVHWTICESDQEWQQAHAAATPRGLTSNKGSLHAAATSRGRWTVVPVLVAVLLLTGGWGWWAGRSRLAQHEAELQSALYLEQWAVTRNDLEAARLTFDLEAFPETQPFDAEFERLVNGQRLSATDPPLTTTFDLVDVRGDLAVVNVHILPYTGPTYRQTRVYRHTEQGWLRTTPDPTLWGLSRSLETDYFIWHYRHLDQRLIVAVADRADALAATIAHTFGLTATGDAPLEVTVSVNAPPFVVVPDNGSILLSSPAAYLAPNSLTDDDLLLQALAFALVKRAATRSVMRPLVDSLALWQLWQLELPLATWRDKTVSTILAGYGLVDMDARTKSDNFAASICTAYRIWLEKPTDLQIPITCGPPSPSCPPCLLPAEPPLLTVTTWMEPWGGSSGLLTIMGASGYSSHPGQVVVLATLVDYLAITYGPEHLPVLLAEVNRHSTWDTLLPAAYGISVAEVQAGWCAYLSDRYGVVCPSGDLTR